VGGCRDGLLAEDQTRVTVMKSKMRSIHGTTKASADIVSLMTILRINVENLPLNGAWAIGATETAAL
jgi:hypothetical protein